MSTPGGSVAVSCTGAVMAIEWVVPANGWSYEGPSVEEGKLEVKFRPASGESIEVKGTCSGGRPILRRD